MNIDAEKMDKQEMNLPYEQPSLKKYGTMKKFTLGTAGSTTEPGLFGDPDSDSTTIKINEENGNDGTDPSQASNNDQVRF